MDGSNPSSLPKTGHWAGGFKMKRAIGIAAVALLALTACQKKAETAATGKPATAAATPPAGLAGPITSPQRKPGLWTQTVSTAQAQQTTKLCLDEASDRQMAWWGAQDSRTTCLEQTITQHMGGGWDFHSVCKSAGGGTTTSSGTATGDFGSHYKVEATSTTSGRPMPQANGERRITIEAAWQGPCPAGMKPGDMELPGGMRINMTGAMSGKGPGGAGHAPNAAEIAQMRSQAKAMKDAK
jgi:hypothetical protein